MFCIIQHLAIILRRALDAFIDHRNDEGGPVAYYGNLRSALEVSQASFQIAISFLGDSMAVCPMLSCVLFEVVLQSTITDIPCLCGI